MTQNSNFAKIASNINYNNIIMDNNQKILTKTIRM